MADATGARATALNGREILTDRLRLRPHRADDLAARCVITADPQTMRFIGGPQSVEDNWSRILRYAGHWALAGYGLFAVEERATGRLVGEAGLMRFQRDLGVDFDAAPEAAWMCDADVTGRGYATEAVAAALAWHESRFAAARAVCIIAPDNVASLRVAEKLGFAAYGEGLYHARPVILHARITGTPLIPLGALG